MTASTTARTVATALADVERWKADEEARHKAEMLEVEQEIKNLQTAIGNLNSQLEALTKFQKELVKKASALGPQEIKKAYESLFRALTEQAALLATRDGLVATRLKERSDSLAQSLSRSEIGAQVEEYRQFKVSVEPTLAALPESYRSVILKHHQGITDKLRDHISAVMAGPVEIMADLLEVDLMYAVDAPDGEPQLLVIVLPIAEEVYLGWHGRGEGAQLWIAVRAVQALYEAATKAGFFRVQAVGGGHLGMLVIEADIAGCTKAFVDGFEKRLPEVLGKAPELQAARVKVTARRVDVDYVLPAEEGSDAE